MRAAQITLDRGIQILQKISLSLVQSDIERYSARVTRAGDRRCDGDNRAVVCGHDTQLARGRKAHVAVSENVIVGPESVDGQAKKSVRSEGAFVQAIHRHRLLRRDVNALIGNYIVFIDLRKRKLNCKERDG